MVGGVEVEILVCPYPQAARTKANLADFGEWHYLFCKLTLSGLPVCVSLSKDLKACLCVNALSLSIHNSTTILDLNLGFLLHWLSTTEFSKQGNGSLYMLWFLFLRG